jgi:hypothetical protein
MVLPRDDVFSLPQTVSTAQSYDRVPDAWIRTTTILPILFLTLSTITGSYPTPIDSGQLLTCFKLYDIFMRTMSLPNFDMNLTELVG